LKLKLGEALVKEALITRDQLKAALERQVMFGGRIGTNIVEKGFMKETELAKFLSRYFKVPAVDPGLLSSVDPEVIECLGRDVVEKYRVVPFKKERKRLHLAMMDPTSVKDIDEIRFSTGYDIIPYIITELRLIRALEKYYGVERDLRYISTATLESDEKPVATENKEELMKLKEQFMAARDKEEIIGLLLAAASKVYSRIAVFLVKPGKISGWKARGLDVEKTDFELKPDSVFSEVISRKTFYRGPVMKIPGNEALIKIVGGSTQDCLVIPIQIRDKIIGLMYIDNGLASVLDANLSYVNRIVSMASISFEITILRMKILDL